MKNMIKSLLIAVCMISAVSVSAQEPAPAAQASDFSVGDTIVIKKDHERYLTGEKMSKWVYNVEHTIQQVGGRRFPDGILIRGIISWVGPDDIVNKTEHPEEAAEHQEAKEAAAQAQQAEAQAAKEAEREAEQARKDSIQQAKEEAAREEAAAKAEQEALEQAEQESNATAQVDSVAEQSTQEPVEQESALQQEDNTDAAYVITEKQKEIENCDRFTIGLRGGAASLMQDAPKMGNWRIGWDVLLDLQYAHYWKKFGAKMQYGLLVGLSAGFAQSGLTSSINDAFSEETESNPGEKSVIDYTITADKVTESDGQLQLEVPIMFSMVHEKGFFMNIGPRIALPVWSPYSQTIENPHIDAFFATEGVHVRDAKITGFVKDEQMKTSGTWKHSTLNIMLGAELGYEYTFQNKNSLGIGVYADYSLYSMYSNTPTDKSLISITEVPRLSTPATVDVLSATDSYAKGVGFFDVGLKLAYHFNWWK